MSRKKALKQRIGELFFQIIPVMIGVYLGLIVSNWSESKQQKQKTDTLSENIRTEIQNNHDRIAKVIEYHELLRDSSRYYLKVKRHKLPKMFRGINVLTLSSSAFETGVQTGLVNEYAVEKIQALNEIYTFQKAYNDFGNILLSSLFSIGFSGEEENNRTALQYLSISMTDVAIKERQLLKAYNNVLDTAFKKP